MGGFINSIGSVLGVKPFKGGPYPDAGFGDKASQAIAPLQGTGESFLNLGTTGVPSTLNQISQMEFGTQPRQATSGSQGAKTAALNPAPNIDTTGLQGNFADRFGNLLGHIQTARTNALGDLQAHYAAKGMIDSSEYRDAVNNMNQQFDSHINDQLSGILDEQHKEQLSTLGNFLGTYQNLANTGGNFLKAIAGQDMNLGQLSMQKQQQAQDALGGFAESLASGDLGGGVPWRIGKSSPVMTDYGTVDPSWYPPGYFNQGPPNIGGANWGGTFLGA